MTHFRNRPHRLLLLIILIIAFALRFKGVWLGYPLPVHPDEPKLVEAALNIIRTGDMNPHFFNYPSLNIYLQASIYKTLELVGQGFSGLPATDIPIMWFYLAGRLFNVLLSVLTIGVTYQIGKRLFTAPVGLASAWFITFSFLHVSHSFTITVDTTVAFWLSLAALMATLIYQSNARFIYYLLGGVFIGLAISSKYTAVIGVAPLLIAHYKHSRSEGALFDRKILGLILAIPAVFLVTTPYAILDYKTFLGALKYEATHYSSGHPGAEAAGGVSFMLYGKYLLNSGYGLFPSFFAIGGFLWMLRKDLWKASLLAITPLLLLLAVGRYKVFFARNIVSAIPFLAIFSGFFIIAAYEWLIQTLNVKKSKWLSLTANILLLTVLGGSVLLPTIRTIQYLRLITLPDTRWVSIEWIEQNLPEGATIGREHYTPPLEDYTDKFNVIPLGYYAVVRKPEAIQNLDYMIVSSDDYDRFLNNPEKYPAEQKAYLDFFKTHELIKEFVPDMKTLAGPKLGIYEINAPPEKR